MTEQNETTAAVAELLLRDPEIVAWLDDYRDEREDPPEQEPPHAA
jgi:hypothetical protein